MAKANLNAQTPVKPVTLKDLKDKFPELTIKQAKFVKSYVDGGNATQAMVDAYDYASRDLAARDASKNLNKPVVSKAVAWYLDNHELSVGQVVKDLRTSIEKGLGQKATNADAIKAMRMVLELHDAFPAKKHKVERTTVNLNADDKSPRQMIKELKALMTDLTILAKASEDEIEGEVVE